MLSSIVGHASQALNERKVEIRVQFKAPVSLPGSNVKLDEMRNELVMRLQPSEVRPLLYSLLSLAA